MAIDVEILTVANGHNLANVNTNFAAIKAALQETVSREGTSPNNMEAALDMDAESIINAGNISAVDVIVSGESIVPLVAGAQASAAASAASAVDSDASADASAASADASAASAVDSAASADASAASAATFDPPIEMPDAVKREHVTSNSWITSTTPVDNTWRALTWSPELGLFVAVSSIGTGDRVMTSPDGVNWTSRTSAVDNDWRAVAWSPELGLFAAISVTGTGNRVMTSKSGHSVVYRGGAIATQYFSIVGFDYTVDTAVGDGAGYFHIPPDLNGMSLTYVHAKVITAGTTGTTDIQIANDTQAVDMLSTKLTIDSSETGTDTAATPAVINAANDDVVTNDLIRIDVDAVSTTAAKGLLITLGFETS